MSKATKIERNLEIRRRYEAGDTAAEIADDYNVTTKRIYAILKNERKRGQLTIRIVNILDRLGIHIGDIDAIAALSEAELSYLPGMGEGSLETLRAYLNSYGRDFGEKPAPVDPATELQKAASRYYEAMRARDAAIEEAYAAHAEWKRLNRASLGLS